MISNESLGVVIGFEYDEHVASMMQRLGDSDVHILRGDVGLAEAAADERQGVFVFVEPHGWQDFASTGEVVRGMLTADQSQQPPIVSLRLTEHDSLSGLPQPL